MSLAMSNHVFIDLNALNKKNEYILVKTDDKSTKAATQDYLKTDTTGTPIIMRWK